MSWTVYGDPGLSFQVDKNGLSISGKGRQQCSPIGGIYVGMSDIKALLAQWTIYRASEASETAISSSLYVTEMKYYLDASDVKATTKPISIIKYYKEQYAPDVYFSTFLPDAYFANVWKLAKLILSYPDMSYQISFGFDCFMPRKIPEHPDVISYEEWLDSRPYISKEDFSFVLHPVRKEKVEPSEKEKYSFDPTQTGI
jgi:hypothetical protein